MPCTDAKSRRLLKANRAKVVSIKPFTIQLLFECDNIVQDITLGIDTGYKNIGFSAITDKKELISGEVKLLTGVSERIEKRKMHRKLRRQRLRYRKARFDNRKINEGWLAPSIQHKYDSHVIFIDKMKSILPITKVILEIGTFDIQKMNDPNIVGKGYQQGNKLGFLNTKQYVLFRDQYKCQNPNCKNKDTNPILHVHHIKYRSNGGTDKPSNLITVCNKCHTSENHKSGFLYEWSQKSPKLKSYKDATYMNIVRNKFVDDMECEITYGYITKFNRVQLGIEKSHANDAFVIAGGTNQIRCNPIQFEQVRRNNRCLEKFYDAKYIDIRTGKVVSASELNCGRTTRNKEKSGINLRIYRGEKMSSGRRSIRRQRYFYQPNDLVRYNDKIYTVSGCSNYGRYVNLKEKPKAPRVELVVPYKFRKGFC